MNLDAFQESSFLQSLGWAITNSIWQGGVVWLLYNVVISVYINAPAKFKNNSGTLFLFSAFLWFIITFFNKFIYLQNNSDQPTENGLTFFTQFYPVTGEVSLKNLISYAVLSLPYLSIAYLLLLLVFSVKLINSYRNTHYIRTKGLKKPPVEWRLFAEKVASHIGINKKIKIWFSRYVDVPATIGFLKPVILIPVASLNQLSTDQLEAIILHELSHIKRNDYLINLFISLIETILFFNPFIVLLIRIIKKERENCCDDFVLQYQYDRHSYASALLSLEQSRNQHLRLALTSTSGKKQLLSRIKRIMEVKNITHSFNYGQKLLALLLMTGIICSVAWLSPGKQSHFYSKVSGKKIAVTKPWMINEPENNLWLTGDDEQKNTLVQVKPGIIKNKLIIPENISETHSEALDNNLHYQTKKKTPSIFNSDNAHIQDINHIMYEYNSKALIAEGFADHAASFAFNDNLFLQQFPDIDFQLFQDLKLSIDISKLKADIEKGYHTLSNIDWNNINKDINESLAKLEKPELEIMMSEKQKIASIKNIEKSKEKNIQRQLQVRLQNFPKDILEWNKKLIHGDSVIYENIDLSEMDEDRNFFREIQDNYSHIPPPPDKRKRSITIPGADLAYRFNPDETSSALNYYMVKKKKKSDNNIMQTECDNEVVLINGKKLNSSRLNKHRSGVKDEKIAIDVDNNKFEIKIEY